MEFLPKMNVQWCGWLLDKLRVEVSALRLEDVDACRRGQDRCRQPKGM